MSSAARWHFDAARWLFVAAIAMAAGLLLRAAPVFAQGEQDLPPEFDSWKLPGWTFTPGVTVGAMYDSNVALAAPDVNKRTANDSLLSIQPVGQLEYFSPRTMFSSGYRGVLRRYNQLSGLDDSDQHGYFSLRERTSRRVTLFAKDQYDDVATTDMLQLNGVPFQRTGGRYNAFEGGVEARLSRTIDLATRIESDWVSFDQRVNVPLIGGTVNGVIAELSRRFTDRISAGVEYDGRLANLQGALHQLTFQQAGATFHYRVTDVTSVDVSAGGAYLIDRTRSLTRTGPYATIDVKHTMNRVIVGAAYRRSYIPSLEFGGVDQSQEATGYLQMPISKNRWYIQESVAWRKTDPFISAELPLSSLWLQNVVGYGVTKWFRLEGYYQYTGQNNQLVEGRITRHVGGVQVVVVQPVRLRS